MCSSELNILTNIWQVSFVLDWVKAVLAGDVLNLVNCGVTTARVGEGGQSWKEIGQKFFEVRQVWR